MLLTRKLKVQTSKKIDKLEISLRDINESLEKVKKAKSMSNTRAQEALRKTKKAKQQSEKYLSRIKEFTTESSNLRDQLISEQKENLELKNELVPLQQMQ